MKRARIRAMVTVPTRRKTTQETSAPEVVNVTETTEENKNISNNVNDTEETCLQEHSLVEEQTQRKQVQNKQVQSKQAQNKQVQNKQTSLSNRSTDCKDESKESTDTPRKKEVAPSLETSNTSQTVSESAKKLAKARKEFQLKHENKTPDRSKLTMYDLIYYNPVTNPMKRSAESGPVARRISECKPVEEPTVDESEDDPSAMPVPQVKVGSDGQLIIDEQSLVIEQTNAKKGREALAKEAIVDDDSSGSGFYKKRQKSKEWPKWETLKFYKALNTVGTDFLLMQSLFPNRTRQEIKLKFKKEEKINRHLVEKALAYHQEFDTEILEKSLATFETSEKEYINAKKKLKQLGTKGKTNGKSEKKRKCRLVASSIAIMDASDEDEEDEPSELSGQDENAKTNNDYPNAVKKFTKRHKKSREEITDEPSELDNVDSLSSYNGCDSDMEVYHVRPTRSGRVPKVKKLQGPDVNELDNERTSDDSSDNEVTMSPNVDIKLSDSFDNANRDLETNENCEDSVKKIIPNIGHVEPGSLVILSKESPEEPGKSVLQVYMVSSNIDSSRNFEESNMTPNPIPARTRQEIELKFEKEEKINRHLVKKALAYQDLDTEILEKSLATLENSEKEYIDARKKLKKFGPQGKPKRTTERRRKCRIVASSIALMDASDEVKDEPPELSG